MNVTIKMLGEVYRDWQSVKITKPSFEDFITLIFSAFNSAEIMIDFEAGELINGIL